jgi:hypothetical protein
MNDNPEYTLLALWNEYFKTPEGQLKYKELSREWEKYEKAKEKLSKHVDSFLEPPKINPD